VKPPMKKKMPPKPAAKGKPGAAKQQPQWAGIADQMLGKKC